MPAASLRESVTPIAPYVTSISVVDSLRESHDFRGIVAMTPVAVCSFCPTQCFELGPDYSVQFECLCSHVFLLVLLVNSIERASHACAPCTGR